MGVKSEKTINLYLRLHQVTKYKTYCKKLLFLLFIGLFLTNSVVYWVIETDLIVVELEDLSDKESEKKEKKGENDSDDKIPIDSSTKEGSISEQLQRAAFAAYLLSFSNLDVPTPPPQNRLIS